MALGCRNVKADFCPLSPFSGMPVNPIKIINYRSSPATVDWRDTCDGDEEQPSCLGLEFAKDFPFFPSFLRLLTIHAEPEPQASP